MQFEITYQYSAELVKKASWQYFLARMWTTWPRVISLVILGILGIVGTFSPSWLGGLCLGLTVVFVFTWINYFMGNIKAANELKDNSIIVKFTDDNVTFQSKGRISIVNWPRFYQVLILKDVWLFFTSSRGSYTVVPASYIDKELDTFITQKLSGNKAKIIRQQGKK